MSGEAQISGKSIVWVGGASERGALHTQRGLPNQDAIGWDQPRQNGLPVLLALSDGHGGASYFRSDAGSQIAVKVALAVGRELADQADAAPDLSSVKREAEDRLLKRIVSEWLKQVAEHLQAHPITDEERESLHSTNPRALERLEKDERIAYGATLLLVIVTGRFLVFCQLGDGDILCIGPTGETQFVFRPGPDQVGEDTASLCMANAWREFLVQVIPVQKKHPPLILASTDGYSKSFVNTEAFCRIGGDYLEMIRNQGVGAVQTQIGKFLAEASQDGSGDDISLGFIRFSEPDDCDSRQVRQAMLERRLESKIDRDAFNVLQEENAVLKSSVEMIESRCDSLDRFARRLLLFCLVSSFLSLFLTLMVWGRVD
jgi:Protein phosphatase 2C